MRSASSAILRTPNRDRLTSGKGLKGQIASSRHCICKVNFVRAQGQVVSTCRQGVVKCEAISGIDGCIANEIDWVVEDVAVGKGIVACQLDIPGAINSQVAQWQTVAYPVESNGAGA